MPRPSRGPSRAIALAAVAVLAAAALGPLARAEDTVAGEGEQARRVRHLLRRATFGVRPAEVEEVAKLGIEAWVDRQLEPELIPDPEVARRLAGFETVALDGAEYLAMLRDVPAMAPPGEGEDRVEASRRRQRELNRLRNLARREIPRAVLLRAVYSRRQLQEVMVEFWRNHFNVDVRKDAVRYYVASWERDVLRKHVFGRFEDFLMATAKHPAMLFYLDNHVSQAPLARANKVLAGRDDDRTNGLNENYARELMELHTVGVDNGYDQDDVLSLSLVLTGWSIDRRNGTFLFREGYHAKGSKRVMGKTVRSSGVEEGEDVIRYLADHKNTRRFVIGKLARFLVADEPPEALVDDVEKVWRKTKGDLGAVTRAILLHPGFYAAENVLTKAKTPFEFVASALRATDADVDPDRGAGSVLGRLADMQQPVYECEDPTGYSDAAVDWMDPGVLAVRWQLAYDLVTGALPGVKVGEGGLYQHLRQSPEVWEFLLVEDVLAGEQPGSLTLAPFRKRVRELRRTWRRLRPPALRREFDILVTLLLGSPEFQRQ